jgi:hypothetical protein
MRSRPILRLLLLAAIAVGAFAVPAAAQAEGPFWYVNAEKLEEEIKVNVDGALTFTAGPYRFNCNELAFDGAIRNGEEKAEGEIDSLVEGPCASNLPGCTVEPLSAQELSWPMAVNSATSVDWGNVKLKFDFSPTCLMYALPPEFFVGGTLEGAWDNETRCFEYIDAGSLIVIGPSWPLLTIGELCLSTAEEGVMTLE